MTRVRVSVLLVASLVALAPFASAQTTGATGAINGRVFDTSKAVLPGVTVTIAATSLMGTRDAVTNEEGQYRFPAVPPGEYTLTYELQGFATVRREGIRVALGFTATVDVEIGLASLAETVTVTGQAPVVDIQSTELTTTYNAELLAAIPTGSRDFWSLLAISPSVQVSKFDVGGSAAMTVLPVNVYGITGQERPLVEGIISNSATGGVGFSFYGDYGSFEEVSISTAGHSAETGSPGLFSNLVSKSGGNTYHGTLYQDYQSDKMQGFNIDPDQIAKGVTGGGRLGPREVNRSAGWHDTNGDLGGFLIPDKLWWYGSYRYLAVKQWFANYPAEPQYSRGQNFTGKFTYQLSNNNKFIGYFQRTEKLQTNRLDAFRLSATAAINLDRSSTWYQDYNSGVWKLEYNRVIGNAAFAEMRGGTYFFHFPTERQSEGLRYEDTGTRIVRGGNQNRVQDRDRPQALGSVSYFKDSLWGTHNFKVGGNYFREEQWSEAGGFPDQVVHVYNNRVPIEVWLTEPGEQTIGLAVTSAYVTDTWQMPKRLTLNLGVRFDRFRSYVPEMVHPVSRWNPTEVRFPAQDNLNTWNLFAPRFGASWAVTGDNKNVVKFNYAKYWYDPGFGLAGFLTPNSNNGLWNRRFAWTDPNGNGVYDVGEQGRLIANAGGTASTALDPNLKDPYVHEVAVWYERELVANVGVRGGVVWRGTRQAYAPSTGNASPVNLNRPYNAFNVPVMIPDPGPDGRIGTADDGPPIPGFNLAPQFVGTPSINVTQNVPNSDGDFLTYEFSGTKRMSNRWSLAASYSIMKSWFNGNEYPEAQSPNTIRTNVFPLTPNDLIGTDGSGRFVFTVWSAKMLGTVELPYGMRLAGTVREQSGLPYGRTFDTTLNYGTVRVLAEPMGTHRQPNVVITDLRLEKTFSLSGPLQASGAVDLFNLFNSNAEERISWQSGSYLRPLQVIPPRVARVSVKLTF
ncbi:MAG: TonB-dependent receptor [Acidobacteria bacterium]|nr:TonB-dependent receptor [Acidobacteriota bacterium]